MADAMFDARPLWTPHRFVSEDSGFYSCLTCGALEEVGYPLMKGCSGNTWMVHGIEMIHTCGAWKGESIKTMDDPCEHITDSLEWGCDCRLCE